MIRLDHMRFSDEINISLKISQSSQFFTSSRIWKIVNANAARCVGMFVDTH